MRELEARRQELARLSDERLLSGLGRLSREDRRLLVEILLHLCEVDRRRLYAELGSGSLFDYCTRQMGWSESAAGRRIAVARDGLPELIFPDGRRFRDMAAKDFEDGQLLQALPKNTSCV